MCLLARHAAVVSGLQVRNQKQIEGANQMRNVDLNMILVRVVHFKLPDCKAVWHPGGIICLLLVCQACPTGAKHQ